MTTRTKRKQRRSRKTIIRTDNRFKNQDISLDNYKVYNLPTPTNNNDAATKKYVGDKKCVFKNGSTTTADINLRSDGFYNDLTFNAGAFCQNITPAGQGGAIVNKNTLETGHLITLNSITPSLARMLQSAIKKEVLVLQGDPSNYTLVYKDPTVLPSVTFKSYSSGVELTAPSSTDLATGIYKYEFELILRTSKTIKVFL